MKLNEVIRRLRQVKGLTQENMAEELKVNLSTFIRWETYGKNIPDNRLESIAKALNVTVTELYEYKENPAMLEEPLQFYKKRKEISITIQLDGTSVTLNEWIVTLKKINAALE